MFDSITVNMIYILRQNLIILERSELRNYFQKSYCKIVTGWQFSRVPTGLGHFLAENIRCFGEKWLQNQKLIVFLYFSLRGYQTCRASLRGTHSFSGNLKFEKLKISRGHFETVFPVRSNSRPFWKLRENRVHINYSFAWVDWSRRSALSN